MIFLFSYSRNYFRHYLMWIRYQRREDKKAAMLRRLPQEVDGVTKNDDDVAVRIKLNEAVISLTVRFFMLIFKNRHFSGDFPSSLQLLSPALRNEGRAIPVRRALRL